MDAVGLLPNEQVQVYNVTNGQRFETVRDHGPRGSGSICVNGAAAHLAEVGHKVIIASYGIFAEAEIPGFRAAHRARRRHQPHHETHVATAEKRPSAALGFALRHCGAQRARLIPQDSPALHLATFERRHSRCSC